MISLPDKVLNRPLLWLFAILAGTVALGLGVLRLDLRTDGAALYPKGNLIVQHTEADRVLFEDPDQLILLVSSTDDGPAVASPEGFRYLKRVQTSLSLLESVQEGRVRSLASLLDVRTEPSLFIGTYLDEIPAAPSEFSALIDRIRRQPAIDGLFLAADGRAAAFYVPLVHDGKRKDFVAAVERWLQSQQDTGFQLRLTGPLIAEATLGQIVLRDLAWLIPLMILAISILLFLSLKTVAGVVVPLVEVIFVLVWTLGIMGHAGVPITLVTTIMPIILMAMAVADEIHLLERVQAHLAAFPKTNDKDKKRQRLKEAVLAALKDVGNPIIVTSLTTSIGFLSFLAASMAPIQHFGIFTALGILLAMALSFTFIPALLVMLPLSWFQPFVFSLKQRTPRYSFLAFERWVVQQGKRGFLIGALLLAVSVPGLFMLSVQDSWIDNFDPDSSLVAAERMFNEKFWGSYRFDVVFAGDNAFFHRAEGIALMEAFSGLAEQGPYVGGVMSYLVPYASIAETVLNKKGTLSSLSQEQLDTVKGVGEWFSASIDLRQYLTEKGDTARARIVVNSPDYRRGRELQMYLEGVLDSLLNDQTRVRYHFSGEVPVASEVVEGIVGNQLRSLAWTLIGVGLLLFFMFSEIKTALTVMAPVIAATLFTFAGIGYSGIPLGIATSMFAALTVGVGVDFAVHFTYRYRHERAKGKDHSAAVLNTLKSAGRAIRWNAVVLALGFLVLTLSAMKPNQSLGVLLAVAMLSCYGTTLFFLPRLLESKSPS